MSKHTPGRWQTAGTVNGYQYEIWPVADRGVMTRKICSVNHLYHDDNRADREEGYDNSEAEANARLIVAAPEMYEALEQLLVEWDVSVKYNEAGYALNKADLTQNTINKVRSILTKIEA
jgi:hypothetical protein